MCVETKVGGDSATLQQCVREMMADRPTILSTKGGSQQTITLSSTDIKPIPKSHVYTMTK